MSSEKLESYSHHVLTNPNSESAFQKTADKFEDDLLDSDDFPAGYFEFVLEMLADSKYFTKPGLWNFLLVLSTEKQKMTAEHCKRIANVITDNYLHYADQDLCLAVCDFIARNYSIADAGALLVRLKHVELNKSTALQGYADEGFKILDFEAQSN